MKLHNEKERIGGIMISIRGSHGELTVNPFGTVTKVTLFVSNNDYNYLDIKNVDLLEWRNYYKQDPPSVLDILDVGYWLKDGTYEPPCHDWRLSCGLEREAWMNGEMKVLM